MNFLICGAQKAGTSALHAYLSTHPSVHMSAQKELHYFDGEEYFSQRKPDYNFYHSHFQPEKGNKLIGEATPIYMYWDNAVRRIQQYNPKMKIIIVLRNPIERAYSHWNMERLRDAEELSFYDAIKSESIRAKKCLPLQDRVHSYIDRGFYCKQINKLWRHFGKKNVLALRHDSLLNNPKDTLKTVTDFLNIDPIKDLTPKKVHKLPYKESMNETEEKYLKNIFKTEITELEKLLGWNCQEWLG